MNDCRCIKLGRFVYEKCLKEKEEKTFETAESVSQLSGEKNLGKESRIVYVASRPFEKQNIVLWIVVYRTTK